MTMNPNPQPVRTIAPVAIAAFVFCSLFHFAQYAARSAPGVMLPELGASLGITTTALGALVGSYYYTYSLTSIAAGGIFDRFGARIPVTLGMTMLAIGCVLFGLGDERFALPGRLLQGVGAAFAFVGAAYIATQNFPANKLASSIGIAQAFGMFGGSMGQLGVAHMIHGMNISWQSVWFGLAAFVFVLACLMLVIAKLPRPAATMSTDTPKESPLSGYRTVLFNPRSWICGICGGLLFLPTTVGDMIWRIPYFTKGLDIEYSKAVLATSVVLFGWVVGCPLLGWISDRIGRRKPVVVAGGLVLLACEVMVLYGPAPFADNIGLSLVFGIASGAAMIPYTIIKEVNPAKVAGTATGIMNFIVFATSAIVSPFASHLLARLGEPNGLHAEQFQRAGIILIAAIIVAIIAVLFLPETGPARKPNA